jgi:hypothetical protein
MWRSNSVNLQFCDGSAAAAVNFFQGGIAYANASLWWAADSTFTTGVRVESGSGVFYTTLPTIAGGTQQTLIGGTATPYASLPFMNTSNGAVMAPIA